MKLSKIIKKSKYELEIMRLLVGFVINTDGKVIEISPTFLKSRKLAHPNLTELNSVNSMSEKIL